MATPLRVLILEDRPEDAELMVRQLHRAGFEPQSVRVETEAAFRAALGPDLGLILVDYSLPQFDALRALALLREREVDIPCIVVTATIGEEAAVECIKQGAVDYILKDRMGRLGPAVANALEQRRLRQEHLQTEQTLRQKSSELAAMTEQLWQMAKLATMGELAASIAHELNNPLATVSLHLEALLAAPGADQQALKCIGEEVGRMTRLVADLLQSSRRRQAQIASVDLCLEMDRTLEAIAFHLRNRGISVVREYACEVPLVPADPQQVRQVLLNLFANASDAMPQGGTLTLRASPAPGGCTFEIGDDGVGIAPEDLPRVMEPFFTTKAEGKGTGLGLAICRRAMQEHGGTISLESQLGRGTTVRLFLPVAGDDHPSAK